MRHFQAFVATLVAFVALDALWLYYVAAAYFKSQLGSLLRAQPDMAAAAVFYVIYAAGLVVLVVAPAMLARSAKVAVWRGAALGLTAYATFDLTNLAIIEGWTLAVAIVDIAWGTIGSSVAAWTGYCVVRYATRSTQEPVR